MRQTWRRLHFLHWQVDPESVRNLYPAGTEPDLLRGRTYVGLVSFQVAAASLPGGVPVGGFGEVNVRLYSRDRQGRQGVVFRSLDVDRLDVVMAGRTLAGLPYRWSRIDRDATDARVGYRCRRRWHVPGVTGLTGTTGTAPKAGGSGRAGVASSHLISVAGMVEHPSPLEVFLTARWGLHLARFGRTWWLPVSHEPLSLYRGDLDALDDGLVLAAGVHPDGEPVSVLACPGAHARLARPTGCVA